MENKNKCILKTVKDSQMLIYHVCECYLLAGKLLIKDRFSESTGGVLLHPKKKQKNRPVASLETKEKLTYSSPGQMTNLELSPLFESLSTNEQYLHNHAFYKINKDNMKSCSKERCEDLCEFSESNELIVYFNDRENILFFNDGEEAIITPSQANMIRHFLLSSSKENTSTGSRCVTFFEGLGTDGEVKKNTLSNPLKGLGSA